MKKHNISIALLITATVLLLSGCGIFSLHPLYRSGDLIVDTDLIGTWQNQEDEDVFVIIDTLEDNKYKFVLIDEEDTVNFVMGLLKLKNEYFIDLYPPDDCSFFSGDNCELLENLFRNYIPAHTFMKFDISGNNIILTEFDNERLIKLFQQKRIRLAHEIIGEDEDYVVITASTDDLRKFITRYANDENAFNEPETYQRVSL